MNEPKLFPLQSDKNRASPTKIPWSVADKAYSAYRSRYGSGQSLERLAERGGFGQGEMDDLYPGWEKEVCRIRELEAVVTMFRKAWSVADRKSNNAVIEWESRQPTRMVLSDGEVKEEPK